MSKLPGLLHQTPERRRALARARAARIGLARGQDASVPRSHTETMPPGFVPRKSRRGDIWLSLRPAYEAPQKKTQKHEACARDDEAKSSMLAVHPAPQDGARSFFGFIFLRHDSPLIRVAKSRAPPVGCAPRRERVYALVTRGRRPKMRATAGCCAPGPRMCA